MATKPELSTNNQGIQNVVVYVSNDNFAYAVNQQNVPQGLTNGSYHPSSHQMAPLAQKCFPDKVKPDYPNFYPANAVISQNGFPVANYQNINVLNQIKNAADVPASEKVRVVDECEYLDSNCVIVGPDGQVRCDSVRSETAESSCSSLSSADEVNQQQEMVVFDGSGVSVRHGGVVLTVGPNAGPPQHQNSASVLGTVPNQQLSVTVPYGWKRLLSNGAIVYISPSNAALGSMEQLREYLLSPGTCKCGLECPLKFESAFSFDPKVVEKAWVLTPDTNTGDLTKLCNHKRKIMSMASLGCKPPDPSKLPKDFNTAKRKKRTKIAGPYSGVSVSQILAQRDKIGLNQQQFGKEVINHQIPDQQIAWPPSAMNSAVLQNRLQEQQQQQQSPAGQQYFRYQDGQQINRVGGSPIVINDSGIVQQQPSISAQQNPQIQHQQIIAPNGQIISIHGSIPHGQVNQVLAQNNLLVHQGSPHQRIFINGQPAEPTGPGRPGIHMVPVSISASRPERIQNQQFYSQPQYVSSQGLRPFVQNNQTVNSFPHQLQQPIQHHHQAQQQQKLWQQQKMQIQHQNQIPVPVQSPQNIDQRVPPLHQHTPPANVWHDEVNRKKVKASKLMKKRPYIIDQQNGRIIEAPCPNIDVRQIPSEGNRVMHFQQHQGTSSPSFLEDPSGYLAQQTALLNSTINRQTGANISFSPNQQLQTPHHSISSIAQQQQPNGIPLPSNIACKPSINMNIRPNNVIHVMKPGVQSYHQLVLPQEVDSSQQECGCEGPYQDGHHQHKIFQRRPDSQPSTPGSLGEDPVTSSTYDKANTSPDSRPIQGGTISTSNVPPQDGSPGPSQPVPRENQFVFRDHKSDGYFDVQKISGLNTGIVTTMASGRTVGSNTITSVLAGKANTATVSINTTPVIPNNQLPQITLNVSKTPLEMVQSVVSSIQVPHSQIHGQMSPQIAKPQTFPSGSILVSSGGQLIMANTTNAHQGVMAPPPPKINNAMPPISVSPMVTNVTAAVSQVIPAVAAQQVLGQQTVLVNTLPGPFVLQPGVTMTMDGMTVGPQLLGNVIQQQIQIDNSDPRRAPVLLSPENKRKGKKRKMPSQTVASMLQNANIVMSPQGFPQQIQMAHSPQNVSATPVMQALTIVPGKAGQLVMNNPQLIANSQPTQQINLLQPVNLLNGGMVQNFPTIQQFIVPNLGSMVMNPDGTATLLQDNIGMQLQLQNVNGQNVLTPVQNSNVFNGGQNILPTGMVIRAPGTSQGKIIQQQHSPGAQFLSPNGSQFLVNGQLSPLIANVSPSQQVTFNAAPQAIRTTTQPNQQEYMMVPTGNIAVSSSNQNTTFVQQNTTIVQQQTTMVSNNQNFQQNQTQQPQRVVENQNFVITNDKQQPMQALVFQSSRQSPQTSLNYRQSVSTQTLVNRNSSSTFCQTSTSTVSSPPDTTTHSPLAPGGQSPPTADTTTHTGSTDDGLSPAPSNSSGSCGDIVTLQQNRQQNCSMAMVHCVSSSEPDSAEMGSQNSEMDWTRTQQLHSTPKMEFTDISSLGQLTQAKKANNPIHMAYAESSTVVSGMHVMPEQMKHDVMNSRAFEKYMQRKRLGDTLVVVEGRHQLFDGDNEVGGTGNRKLSNRFVIGDLVWGPAKGCQAWPGKIELLSDGKVTVRWFGGDKSATDVDPAALQTLTEGLDAHHGARKRARTSRKLNTQLENAIQEAMRELDKKSDVSATDDVKIRNKLSVSDSPEKKATGRLRSSQR